jgi:hypothetical protein
MAFKKLYVNGDSWTYGQELGDDRIDELDYKFYNTWPWHLSQRMEIPQLINDGLGGGSCDRIFRTTVEYIKSQVTIEDTIFVLGWTSRERFEWPLMDTLTHHNGTDLEKHEYLKYVSVLFSQEVSPWTTYPGENLLEATIEDKVARLNALKNKWFRIREYEADTEKVEQYLYILDELVNAKGGEIYHFWALENPILKYSILKDSLMSITRKNGWSLCQKDHPDETTHKKIADIIYNGIENKRK